MQFASDLVKTLAVAILDLVAKFGHRNFDTVALLCLHICGYILGKVFLENFIICIVGTLCNFYVNLTFSERF